MGAPCVHAGGEVSSSQSTASWVSDLRGDPLHWVTATSAPCTSTFHPARVDQPVDQASTFGPDPTNRFDRDTRWWAHELLHRLVLRDHESSLAAFAADRDRLESGWIAAPPTSEVAFAASAEAERRWLAALVAADHREVRPPWLIDLWRDLDDAAGLPAVDEQT
jgi:dipeptidase